MAIKVHAHSAIFVIYNLCSTRNGKHNNFITIGGDDVRPSNVRKKSKDGQYLSVKKLNFH